MPNPLGLLPLTRSPGLVVVALLTVSVLPGAAQQDSAASQLHTVLRAFYFNLAHRDWEAIAADVLSAKIVASRPMPMSLSTPSPSPRLDACVPVASLVEQAIIRQKDDWAAVSVPRCGLGSPGADEFRLIHFEKRWRFTYIALLEEPGIASAE